MAKANYITVIDGREYDANGFEISRIGSTSYVGVVRESGQKAGATPIWWAYRTLGAELYYSLYGHENLGSCVWVVNEYRKAMAANDATLRNYGKSRRGMKEGTAWGQQFDVPTEFEYELFTPETLPQKEKKAPVGKARKVARKETNITVEFVERQVNILLGNKVALKDRVAIREAVVANVAFYNSVSDVTAYVNDLVNYKFA